MLIKFCKANCLNIKNQSKKDQKQKIKDDFCFKNEIIEKY
jgi:hypothetical protein